MDFVLCSYREFHPNYWHERNTRGNPAHLKTLRTSVSAKFKSVNKTGRHLQLYCSYLRVVSYPVAMLLQLNGFLLLWKIRQARLNISEVSEVVGTNLVELICGGKTSGSELNLKMMLEENFRMSRACFVNLVSELRPYISPGQSHLITGHWVRKKRWQLHCIF